MSHLNVSVAKIVTPDDSHSTSQGFGRATLSKVALRPAALGGACALATLNRTAYRHPSVQSAAATAGTAAEAAGAPSDAAVGATGVASFPEGSSCIRTSPPLPMISRPLTLGGLDASLTAMAAA